MLAEKDYWHRLAEVPTQKMAEALENLVKVYAPSHADMNLEAVLKALETGWQLTQVILTRGVQAVPGLPSVLFRLKQDDQAEVGIPVVIGPKVLTLLQERGEAWSQQGVSFLSDSEWSGR
jgi:hypothetical protein